MDKTKRAQLEQQLEKLEEEWMNLKVDLRMGKLKDVHQPRKKRKEIARIKTQLNEDQKKGKKDEKAA
jgi:ribosomal protein L29